MDPIETLPEREIEAEAEREERLAERLSATFLWFRSRLQEAKMYGLGGFLLIAGWLLSVDSVVSLSHPEDRDKHEAALLLLIFVPLLWVAWYVYMIRLRRQLPEHDTVSSRASLHIMAWVVALALSVVLYFVALD